MSRPKIEIQPILRQKYLISAVLYVPRHIKRTKRKVIGGYQTEFDILKNKRLPPDISAVNMPEIASLYAVGMQGINKPARYRAVPYRRKMQKRDDWQTAPVTVAQLHSCLKAHFKPQCFAVIYLLPADLTDRFLRYLIKKPSA